LPLLGALILAFIPKSNVKGIRWAALITTLVTFLASLAMYQQVDTSNFHFQLKESMAWIPNWGVNYRVGVDGISVWLVLLSTFLMVISAAFSFYVDKRVKDYMVLLLMLETAMLGVFVSLDMIVFYTFFEASLIPMALLIWIWGGERRNYAAIKFFVYTFAGSIFMLIAMISLAYLNQKAVGSLSFSLEDIQHSVAIGSLWNGVPFATQALLFWAFMIAFLIKTPAFPFHTWLPDAHVEAPTAGSVILAGVLLKMGTFGFLRFVLPLFPEAVQRFVPVVMALAVIGIIYGAIVAAVQPDVKKLVAYSSVAHMGFVLLGIFSLTHTGILGGAMQQLNHGVSTGGLFLLIGLIYERRHTRLFKDYGGLKAQMPIYAALFLIVMLSSVGLPGTNGFIGEFLAMMGAFQSSYAGLYGLNMAYPVIAGFGVVLAAVYLLYMFQQMFYGPNDNPENRRLKDIKPWEIALVGALLVFIVWGGIYPSTFLKPMEASVAATRMMATNPAGQRPSWKDPQMSIDLGRQGALVKNGEVVAPGNVNARIPGAPKISEGLATTLDLTPNSTEEPR
jgi:NADH-quinone oxidoreductase subunit M